MSNYLLDPNGVFSDRTTVNLTKLAYNLSDAELAEKRMNEDIVIMNFFFDTPIISNFKLEMKVTVFDQISAIGGTLGKMSTTIFDITFGH